MLSERRDNPVVVCEREGTGDLCGLLADGGGEGSEFTAPLERNRSLVEATRPFHVLVQRQQFVVARIWEYRFVDGAIRTEHLDGLNVELGNLLAGCTVKTHARDFVWHLEPRSAP